MLASTKKVDNHFPQHFYLRTRYYCAAVHCTEAKTWSWWKTPQFSAQSIPPSSPPPDIVREWAEHTKQAGRERRQQAQRSSTPSCRNSQFQGQVKPVTKWTSSKAAELQVPSPCLQHCHCKTSHWQRSFTTAKPKQYFKCSLGMKSQWIRNTDSCTEVSGILLSGSYLYFRLTYYCAASKVTRIPSTAQIVSANIFREHEPGMNKRLTQPGSKKTLEKLSFSNKN